MSSDIEEDISLSLPFPTDVFRKRRRKFQEQMSSESVALFFSAPSRLRSHDISYPFRQDSDFFYLTGFSEENSVLVLDSKEELLYAQDRDEEKETWEGIRLGPERVPSHLGIKRAKAKSSFYKDLGGEILNSHRKLYYRFGLDKERDASIFSALRNLMKKGRAGIYSPEEIISPESILHEMRLVKSHEERKLLEEAAKITDKGHRRLLENTRPQMFEYELEAMLEYEFRRADACQAYPPIVASGRNACILHYTQNKCQLREGEIVLVDAGAEKHCMSADLTRSFPVGAKFKPLQKEVYEIVLLAQKKAIESALPGSSLEKMHDRALLTLLEGLVDLKVLKGNAQKHFEEGKEIEESNKEKESEKKEIPYQRYFMHKTSHWLGMDVHDVGSYFYKGKARSLKKGMVCTVEPGLYFSPDEPSLSGKLEELRGLGIRIEDDIYIQDKKALVLTASTPKEVSELEEIRGACLKKNHDQ